MKLRVLICLLLAFVMVIGFSACSQKTATDEQDETKTEQKEEKKEDPAPVEEEKEAVVAKGRDFPIVEEKLTLTAFAAQGVYTTGDFNDLEIWKVYEDMTNIKIDFDAYPMGDHNEKLSLVLASNNLPDFFFKTTMDSSKITKYAEQGLIVPLSPYLEDYSPNYYNQIQMDATLESSATMKDGNIYGFTYLVPAAPAQTMPIFVNEKWLTALGEIVPTTTDGLIELLKIVRDADLNSNGEADEIPLVASVVTLQNAFMGSFGLGTRGNGTPNIDFVNDEIRYMPVSPEYKELLMFLNTLYTEKLISQEIFDMGIPEMTATGEQNQIFMGIFNIRDYIGETYKEDFIGVYEPFEGPHGDQLYSIKWTGLAGQNTFISATNEHPEATVRWVDYFYSEPGIELYFMGIKDVTYEINDKGLPVYTDYVKDNPDGLNIEEVLGSYVPWSGGSNPSMAEDRCFGTNMYPPLEQGITKALFEFAPPVVWGNFNYSTEDVTKMTILEQDIETYVIDMRAKLITGNESFDVWDEYIETINKMGLDELMEIYERGLADYNSTIK